MICQQQSVCVPPNGASFYHEIFFLPFCLLAFNHNTEDSYEKTVTERREFWGFTRLIVSCETGHLKGSTGADSSRKTAASKHSAASCNDNAVPSAL